MSDVNRRQVVKMTALGIAVAGATGAISANQAQAQQGDFFGAPEKRWAGHATAKASELTKSTKPHLVKVGIAPPSAHPTAMADSAIEELRIAHLPMGVFPQSDQWGAPRPDLNGLRVKLPNRGEIYLIDRGYRRWIPNPATYNNLFRDWNGVVTDIDVNEIPLGTQVSDGAVLERGDGTAPVYLIDQGEKRWITSPAIMDQYYFNWDRVYVVPPASLDSIAPGPNIDS